MFKNEKGFTLVEMLVVLMIISVLIILIVPNISRQTSGVNDKGCEALISVVEAQVQAFYIEEERYPENIGELQDEGFLKDNQATCPNGGAITVSSNGNVSGPND